MGPVKEFVLVQASKWQDMKDKCKNQHRNLPSSASALTTSESVDMSKPDKVVSTLDKGTDVAESRVLDRSQVEAWTRAGADQVGVEDRSIVQDLGNSEVAGKPLEVIPDSAIEEGRSTSVPSSSSPSASAPGSLSGGIAADVVGLVGIDSNVSDAKQSKKHKRYNSINTLNASKLSFTTRQRSKVIKHWIKA